MCTSVADVHILISTIVQEQSSCRAQITYIYSQSPAGSVLIPTQSRCSVLCTGPVSNSECTTPNCFPVSCTYEVVPPACQCHAVAPIYSDLLIARIRRERTGWSWKRPVVPLTHAKSS